MNSELKKAYDHIRSGGSGFFEQKRGLIAVWGKEAVQFLDGLISNDVKTLEDGAQMLAAFPNAKGRLLALVRVLRQGDRYLFETEDATREKIFQNLFRFTFAGDFFVEDLSDHHSYFQIYGNNWSEPGAVATGFLSIIAKNPIATAQGSDPESRFFQFTSPVSRDIFIPPDSAEAFRSELAASAVRITEELYETLRIENGIPTYGVDMDETTIVPELYLTDAISYNKGCYIGQEIIARIHFRGHVAKQLTGLILSEPPAVAGGLTQVGANDEITTPDGKNAGRITSVTYSPKLEKSIALAFVRYDYLADGTELLAGDVKAHVHNLPFIS